MGGPRDSITCVDCGGDARLVTFAPEDGAWEVGDIITYRCRDCRDRWDLVLELDDLSDDGDGDAGDTGDGQPFVR